MGRARNFAREVQEKRSVAAKKGAALRALAGPRVTRKMRTALDAMARGLDRDAAAAEAKMNPRVLARNLNLPHIRALLADRVQAMIEAETPAAVRKIAALRDGSASDYVALAAAQDQLNRAGVRRPDPNQARPTQGVRITFISVNSQQQSGRPGITIDGVPMDSEPSPETAMPPGDVSAIFNRKFGE